MLSTNIYIYIYTPNPVYTYIKLPTMVDMPYNQTKSSFGWVLWYISLCRLLITKSIFMQTELFQTI